MQSHSIVPRFTATMTAIGRQDAIALISRHFSSHVVTFVFPSVPTSIRLGCLTTQRAVVLQRLHLIFLLEDKKLVKCFATLPLFVATMITCFAHAPQFLQILIPTIVARTCRPRPPRLFLNPPFWRFTDPPQLVPRCFRGLS